MANKMRLIDANALKKRMLSYYECVNEHTSKSTYTGETLMDYEVADMIEDCIDNAPTVDAVEVVRCKDCKHWHEETGWCNQHSHFIGEKGEACHPWESNDWKMLNEDDFCSYGERKDNEN